MRWRRRTQDSIQQREYLQRKEEEDRHALVSLAWERWRDKYEEAKLSEVVRTIYGTKTYMRANY